MGEYENIFKVLARALGDISPSIIKNVLFCFVITGFVLRTESETEGSLIVYNLIYCLFSCVGMKLNTFKVAPCIGLIEIVLAPVA